MFVIDAYKMQIQQHLQLDSQGFASCEYFPASSTMVFSDARGTIYLLADGQHSKNSRHKIDEYEPEAEAPGISPLDSRISSASRASRSTVQSSVRGSSASVCR